MAFSLTWLATFFMWLMWTCIYLAQLNPMLTVVYQVYDPAAVE